MKEIWKGFAGWLIALFLICGISNAASAATGTQNKAGKCGENVTWNYNDTTKTVSIHGKGTVRGSYDWEKLDVRHVTIDKGIEKIGSYAFEDMEDLETVSIPDTVKSIGYCAFYNTGLKSVTVKSSVKNVAASAFESCRNLQTVNWYAKTIPNDTFYDCKKLTNIQIKSKVKIIGRNAFYGTAIKSFVMPDSVTTVGTGAFGNCKKLKQLTFSKNVKTIPASVAKNTTSLKKVVIKQGTEKIASNAFKECGVENIIIPKSVKSIGSSAFYHAEGLKTVQMSAQITAIEDSTFEGCKSLETFQIGKSVSYIGECAFLDCSSLKAIVIPGNVKVIDYKAFENTGCQSVVVESGVTTIEYWAFHNCDKLASISICETVTSLQPNALVDCDSLTEIKVSVDNANYSSENGCLLDKAHTTLFVVPAGKEGVFDIPVSITKVETTAFCGCLKITEITSKNNQNFATEEGILYNSDKSILISCPSQKEGSIIIPSTVIIIEESAFQQSNASHIYIPNSVQQIGYCAFEYCKKLTSIEIPESVATVSNAAFWGCENLQKVTIGNGVKKIQRNAFHECKKLEKVILPTSVYSISKSAFKDCNDVTFYCKKSSYAMSFAVKYNIEYKII